MVTYELEHSKEANLGKYGSMKVERIEYGGRLLTLYGHAGGRWVAVDIIIDREAIDEYSAMNAAWLAIAKPRIVGEAI